MALPGDLADVSEEDLEDDDDAAAGEAEELEERVVDQASAARTISELRREIEIFRGLEALAVKVRESGTDRKWDELSRLLQTGESDVVAERRKLIIFTEHRDTLNYLQRRITAHLGHPETKSLGPDGRPCGRAKGTLP